MTSIISNRSIAGRHAFPAGTLAACFAFWGTDEEFLAFSTIGFLFAFFFYGSEMLFSAAAVI